MLHRHDILFSAGARRLLAAAAGPLACAATLAFAGCDNSGTSLLVTATFDSSLNIDQLLVLGEQAGSPPSLVLEPGVLPPTPGGLIASGASIGVMLPDQPPVRDFVVVVDGRAGGIRAAAALGTISLKPRQENDFAAKLSPVKCDSPEVCLIGERRCDPGGWAICLADQRGCGIWSDTKACPGGGQCDNGACVGGCLPGQHFCGPTCVSDSDPQHCGASCSPCATAPNASAACDGHQCQLACASGYRLCLGLCLKSDDPKCR